ncbi:MAG TPA: GDSL-type esterase/lipase family protein [Aliidongia sp.]|nr:GDSL-type esterase/lipase family protein [Aliidongia sp.]
MPDHSAEPGPTDAVTRRLPARDYILLPLVVVATITLLMVVSEVAARIVWPEQTDVSCAIGGPATSERFRPNCTAETKAAEGPWVSNQFNECGYRSAESCRPAAPGQLRAVVMGSSTSRGALVAYEDTFAARASAALTRLCRQPFDFQNLGTDWGDLATMDRRVPEALALKPNAIVITVGPFDLSHLAIAMEPQSERPGFTLHDVVGFMKTNLRIFIVAQHYLYRDPAAHVSAFLSNKSDSSSYVQSPLPPVWQERAELLGRLIGRIAAQTRPVGVPVLLFYVPDRAHAALSVPQYARPGLDPAALGEALRTAAQAEGAEFADLTPDFAAAGDFASLYYPADGHPSAGGHRIIGRRVVEALLQDPAFAQCRANSTMIVGQRAP